MHLKAIFATTIAVTLAFLQRASFKRFNSLNFEICYHLNFIA